MPDMHLLGQVRRGEVDHHTLLGARLVHRKLRIGQRGFEALGQGVAVLEEVEKARTGDLDLADLRVLGQCGDELLGQLRGFMPAGLASIMAMLLAKSP